MSNACPVVAERGVVQRQQDRCFAGAIWIGIIQGPKHPALNINIGIKQPSAPLLLAQHVLVVLHVFAPIVTVLLLSLAVEECALLVEVLFDVRLQFFRFVSHRCNVLFVLRQRFYSLPLLFCLLFSHNFLISFFFFLFSQNFLFSFLLFFQSELI